MPPTSAKRTNDSFFQRIEFRFQARSEEEREAIRQKISDACEGWKLRASLRFPDLWRRQVAILCSKRAHCTADHQKRCKDAARGSGSKRKRPHQRLRDEDADDQEAVPQHDMRMEEVRELRVADAAVLRPVLVLLTLPITILTFGLFLIVINAALLLLASEIVRDFEVDGFVPAFLGAIVISVAHLLLDALMRGLAGGRSGI